MWMSSTRENEIILHIILYYLIMCQGGDLILSFTYRDPTLRSAEMDQGLHALFQVALAESCDAHLGYKHILRGNTC